MRFNALRKADTNSWEHLKAETWNNNVEEYNTWPLFFSVMIKGSTYKSAEEDTESSRSLRMFKSRIGLKNHSLKKTDHTTFVLSHTDGFEGLLKRELKENRIAVFFTHRSNEAHTLEAYVLVAIHTVQGSQNANREKRKHYSWLGRRLNDPISSQRPPWTQSVSQLWGFL